MTPAFRFSSLRLPRFPQGLRLHASLEVAAAPDPGLQPGQDGGAVDLEAAAGGQAAGHGVTLSLAGKMLDKIRRSGGESGGDKPLVSAPAVIAAAADEKSGEKAAVKRRTNRRPVLAPAGTFEHALAHAIRTLGMERVAALTGRGKSALYAAVDPASPKHIGGLTLERALLVAGAVAAAGGPGHLFALPFLRAAGAEDGGAAPPSRGFYAHAARLGALYGDTAAALSRLFDAAEGQTGAKPPPADLKEAALAAIDREINGLHQMRALLLTGTALAPLPGAVLPTRERGL